MNIDILAKHYNGLIKFEGFSEKGKNFIQKHWSIDGEFIHPENAQYWIKEAEKEGLKVELIFCC